MNNSIVFNLQPNSSNQSLLIKTIKMIDYVYFDNYQNCKLQSDETIKEFSGTDFIDLKNDIHNNGGGKANFSLQEFILLAKSMLFVAKYYRLNPDNKISQILKSEHYPKSSSHSENEFYGSKFDFEKECYWYVSNSEKVIENFKSINKDLPLLLTFDNEIEKFEFK